MLINNKSLINTINKLNLTDDEREKFNKISEDDRGNFLYNGKPITGGATAEQAAQIEANKNAIGDENNGLTKEINDINDALTRVDAITLNGKKISNPMTKEEYDSIVNKDENTIYLVDDNNVITGIPDYSTSDANKLLAVNSTGTALAWIETPNGSGLTDEQINKLNSIDNKVDKITGKQLSTEDYTSQEKTNLANLKTIIGDNNSGLVKDVADLKNNGVSQDNINTAVNNYLTEHPVSSGATAEQIAQIEANKTAIGDENSGLIKEVNDLKNASGTFKNIYANNDIPTVFITSNTLTKLNSKADGKANCEFEIRFKNQIIKCFGTGKVQGNSSASYPGKNYTFNFYSDKENTTKFKIDVGWGAQNKYCFKKNWVDSTHTRNLSGARIAYDMVNSRPESDFKTNLLSSPHNGSVDGFPVKVYVNGEFWGLYTWNIPKDAWMFNMDDSNPNHMVLCAEYNNNGNNTLNTTCEFRATWGGESDANWSIEVGTYSETLKNSFNNAISHVMNSSDEDFKTNFSNYFDLYSILDYYCFSYLTAHIDGLGKNILMATYDGVHWGACLYDMDSIYGADWNGQKFKDANIRCPEDYQETNSLLWQRVVRNFSQELYDRYFELRNGALSLGNIITHVEEIYNLIPDRVFNNDYQKWTGIPSQTSNTITRFRNYMKDRAVYCDERFKELLLDKSVTAVTITGKTEVKIGSSITLTANLTPSVADVKTGSWSASNTNVTLNDSNSLSVVVNGSVLGSSTITFTSDDTTNGTISATYDVNVVETSAVSDIDYSEGYINDSGNLAYLINTYVDNKYININSASNVIIYTTTGGITCFRLAEYDENKNFIKRSYKATNNLIKATSDEFILDTNTKYIRVGFGMPEPVTEEMLNKLFGEYTINNEIAPNNLLYEEGGINSTTGLNEDSAEKYRTDYVELCCNYVSVNTGIVNSDLHCTIRFYDKEKNILSNVTSNNIYNIYIVDNLKYIRLVLVNNEGTKVTINENDAVLINGLKYVLEKQ